MEFSKSQKGLTLLEVIIAIGILGAAISGIIILLVNISNYGSSAEVRTIAVQKAQETIDIIKNIRDNEYCSFFEDYPDGYYDIQKTGDTWQLNSVAVGHITLSELSEIEKKATGNMGRQIYLENILSEDNEVKAKRVNVNIEWETKGTPEQDYTMIADLYKWNY